MKEITLTLTPIETKKLVAILNEYCSDQDFFLEDNPLDEPDYSNLLARVRDAKDFADRLELLEKQP